MIGVAVEANERLIAAEFFELLKTPWEFFRIGQPYDVVICTSGGLCCQEATLLLIFAGEQLPVDAEEKKLIKSQVGGFVVSDEGKRLPIYGAMVTFPGSPKDLLTADGTQEAVAYLSCRGGATVLRIGYNLFAEVRFLLTEGQPAENAALPTLDEHIAILRGWITLAGIPLVEIPPVPEGYKFIACLTHDLDHPTLRNHWFDHTMFGFLFRATIGTLGDVCRHRKSLASLRKNLEAVCLLPFVHLGMAKDFWHGFDRYLDIERGAGSTFFVIPQSNYAGRTAEGPAPSARGCRYELDQLVPQLKKILSAGGEIGVHGLDAWLDADEGRKELERVSQAVGSSELGVRMHWLYFDSAKSPAILEKAGFDYDTTVGYRETVGFRAGTAQAYKPPGTEKLLELPLHVMDTALFYPDYLHLRQEEAERVVGRLIDEVEQIGGALTVNWHDRSIAPERLWEDFYRKLLGELRSRGAWLSTSRKAAAWFRSRRTAVVESVCSAAGAIKVQGRLETTEPVPGLKIRIHKPRAGSLSEPKTSRKAGQFVDVPFAGTTELNFTI